jgi:hypothetical protein
MESRITAKELNQLTGMKTLRQSLAVIAKRLERRNWRCHTAGGERSFRFAGMDWDKGFVLLIASWRDDGGVGYRYARLPFEEAIDTISGRFSSDFLADRL